MSEDAEAEIVSTPQADTTEVEPSSQHRPRVPLLTAAIVPLVLVVDQLTKRWAVSELSGSQPHHVIWTLQWNLTRNSGMAFSQAQGIGPLIGIAALLIGIVLGLVFHPSVPEVIQPYLPIAVVAALDAVFGGLRAYLERIFDSKVFVVSFVFNVLVAALIVYVGDQLGVGTQLSTAIIVVLGIRIFGNAAALRRRLFGA